MSSMWRNNPQGEQVCRTNDCWREEGWMEAKKQRGRPPAAGGRAAQPRELSLQSYISSIIQIEGQRCATQGCGSNVRSPNPELRKVF